MSSYSEEWCLTMGVLMKTRVMYPDPLDVEDEVTNCITESTDPVIAAMPWGVASKIAEMPPWTIDFQSENTCIFKLYKLWYQSITLPMGLEPQVRVISDKEPEGMPSHWIYIYSPVASLVGQPIVGWVQEDNVLVHRDSDGPEVVYMHPQETPYEEGWGYPDPSNTGKAIQIFYN